MWVGKQKLKQQWHTYYNNKILKHLTMPVAAKDVSSRNFHSLLVGMQNSYNHFGRQFPIKLNMILPYDPTALLGIYSNESKNLCPYENLHTGFFFPWACSMRKSPSQGLNLCHSSNQSHSRDSTGFLTRWATREILYTAVYSSFIHNCQNLKANKMPFGRWMDKWWDIQTMKLVLKRNKLSSHKKTWKKLRWTLLKET